MRYFIVFLLGFALSLSAYWWNQPSEMVTPKPSPRIECPQFDEDGPTINIGGVCDVQEKH